MDAAAIPIRWAVEQDQRELVLTELFSRHGESLVRLAYCLIGERELAEEAVQDAYLSLYRNWRTVRKESSSLAYLRATVINRCRSDQRRLIRARTRDPLVAMTQATTVPSSEASVIAQDESSRIFAEVGRLPQRQREVVVCRYYLDLSERQTAELLGISLGSVKRHAHRGLAHLQSRLGENR
ncbi:sigma-70 family RNA polymerase sigma factor [Intrasporangium calvum]|uniref:Sigma-70 family RNA polymerase sigma factor n=1 Tax=Intrasporangium calvum TaxID=53358 RepID=A0ABT5GEN2_9MICO|nr:sigma-70 family RNA polymerase sigma factor [Intrasporangium calvum]MDC5696360.1 sigma-70 family RNA polymerase sigma factor [Intrasporangium calvum]